MWGIGGFVGPKPITPVPKRPPMEQKPAVSESKRVEVRQNLVSGMYYGVFLTGRDPCEGDFIAGEEVQGHPMCFADGSVLLRPEASMIEDVARNHGFVVVNAESVEHADG